MSAKNMHEKVKLSLVDGAAGDSKITVTGLTTADQVVAVFNLTDLLAVSLAGLALVSGGFTVTANTEGKKLLVQWLDSSAG